LLFFLHASRQKAPIRRVFSSDADGRSLGMLRRRLEPERCHVLLVRGRGDAVAGAVFCVSAAAGSAGSALVLEDGEMSVFASGSAERVLEVSAWAGPPAPRPHLELEAGERGLVVADNALALDEDLARGIARPSLVFARHAPLLGAADDGAFVCLEVEVFVFDVQQ